ncbi:MAG: hypothetical protein ACRD96_07355, partial [Bryobacteraceae bacterium]
MRVLTGLALAVGCAGADPYSYWIQPCAPALAARSGCESGDPQLAEWALDAWRAAGGGRIAFVRTGDESKARIRIYWAAGDQKLYGEA